VTFSVCVVRYDILFGMCCQIWYFIWYVLSDMIFLVCVVR